MASEWAEVAIADVAVIRHGFAFKGEHFSESPQDHVLATPGNFEVGGGFKVGKPKYYSGPVPETYVLKEGDVVVTMTDLSKGSDTLGYAAAVPATMGSIYLHNQRVGRVEILRPELVCKEWLHYLMRTSSYRSWVIGSASGTTVKHTSPSRIGSYRFKLPSLDVQRNVAGTLDSLGRRIELLRQSNVTLESITQALFKSWFVDFDPVHANVERLTPMGMDTDTAALFPTEFEESELGSIPKGWLTGTFGSIAQQSKGSVNPLNFSETVYDHYSLPAFDAGLMPVRELGEAIKSNKTPVPSCAVLISKLNPHIPRIWFAGEVRPNAVCSTEFLVWTPADGVPIEYIYCVATSAPFNTAMKQLVTGTSNSHQRVKPEYLAAISTVVPPREVAKAFEAIAGPLLQRVLNNRSIAQSLALLRDALLPRLISGKLRLPDAEAAVEEALA